MLYKNRPITPALGVYRLFKTKSMGSNNSFMNRPTGFALLLGLIYLIFWTYSLMKGAEAYKAFINFSQNPIMIITTMFISLCFFFHFFNGIRYMLFNSGMFLNKKSIANTGFFMLICTLIFTFIFWTFILI